MERRRETTGGIPLYKTHFVIYSTMEKVKAHDSYKHICYWVLQLLYFEGLEPVISTRVSLESVFRPSFHVAFHRTIDILFCTCTRRSTSIKQAPGFSFCSFTLIQHQVFWLWYRKLQPGTDSLMHIYGSLLQGLNCPMKGSGTLQRTLTGQYAGGPITILFSENQSSYM